MKRDIILFINDIMESIKNIEAFSNSLTKEKYEKDKLKQSAIERQLGIIGEAVKNLPNSFRDKYSHVPWKDIAGFRDILTHAYFGLIDERVWRIIKKDLPILKKNIREILEKEKTDENNMFIKSDEDYVGGKPRIDGHRIWVSHIVIGIEAMGLEEYIEDYRLGDDLDIMNKIKEALKYCMNEKCVNAIKYCQDCSKDEKGCDDLWKVAKKLYGKYFVKRDRK